MVQWYQLVLPCEMKVTFLELIHADAAGHLKFAKCVPHVIRRGGGIHGGGILICSYVAVLSVRGITEDPHPGRPT